MCSPVESHDLVPSLSDNPKRQTHSRVSECDGRPSIQVKPSPVNRMVTTSAGAQQFTLHVDLFANHLNHKFHCMYLQSQTKCLGT